MWLGAGIRSSGVRPDPPPSLPSRPDALAILASLSSGHATALSTIVSTCSVRDHWITGPRAAPGLVPRAACSVRPVAPRATPLVLPHAPLQPLSPQLPPELPVPGPIHRLRTYWTHWTQRAPRGVHRGSGGRTLRRPINRPRTVGRIRTVTPTIRRGASIPRPLFPPSPTSAAHR